MTIDSNVNMAITCEKCGRINVSHLNLFAFNKFKEKKLSCSCGSLNCIIYLSDLKNINLSITCVDCGEEHIYKYGIKKLLTGTDIICPETLSVISVIGDRKDISEYIKYTERNTFEVLYDEKFELFFNNHSIMKKSLDRLQFLKENNEVNCDCGNEDIATEVFSDRIELRCTSCEGVKVIYAEHKDDLKNLYDKPSIDMKMYEFDFIDALQNSDNKL